MSISDFAFRARSFIADHGVLLVDMSCIKTYIFRVDIRAVDIDRRLQWIKQDTSGLRGLQEIDSVNTLPMTLENGQPVKQVLDRGTSSRATITNSRCLFISCMHDIEFLRYLCHSLPAAASQTGTVATPARLNKHQQSA